MHTLAIARISLGLVNIPVRVYASVESKAEINFNLLHGRCSARLQQQYTCTKCEEVVAREDMVKGYQFAKDRFVTFTADDLKLLEQAEKPLNQRIAITHFVDSSLSTIGLSVAHVEACYFVGPNEGSEEAFAMLLRAMKGTRTEAVAKYTARGRTHLVVLDVQHDRLEMMQLRTAAELRSITDVPTFDIEPDSEGVRLTEKLIEQYRTDKLELAGYVDEQRQRLLECIQQKIDGEEIVAAPTSAEPEPIVDMAEALKASLKPSKKRPRRATPASST